MLFTFSVDMLTMIMCVTLSTVQS